jgi:hypothetical protein
MLLGHFRELLHFRWRVQRAPLRRLRQRQHPRFRVVQVFALRDDALDFCWDELAIFSPDGEDFAATAEELWRTTLVGIGVRNFMAEDGAIAGTDMRERECVGHGAAAHKKHCAVGVQQLADQLLGTLCDRISSIRRMTASVDRDHCGQGFGGESSGVVAGEVVMLGCETRERHAVRLPALATVEQCEVTAELRSREVFPVARQCEQQ